MSAPRFFDNLRDFNMLTRFACVVSLLWSASAGFAQEAISGWHDNLDRARKIAREQGKPLLIVFRCVR